MTLIDFGKDYKSVLELTDYYIKEIYPRMIVMQEMCKAMGIIPSEVCKNCNHFKEDHPLSYDVDCFKFEPIKKEEIIMGDRQ